MFFFAVACASCEAGARSVVTAQRQVGDTAQFLAVDIDPTETPMLITEFLTTVGNQNLPATVDYTGSLTTAFQVSGFGTLVIVDSNGNVTYRAHEPHADEIVQAVRGAGQG